MIKLNRYDIDRLHEELRHLKQSMYNPEYQYYLHMCAEIVKDLEVRAARLERK